jgi:hypothetical protein
MIQFAALKQQLQLGNPRLRFDETEQGYYYFARTLDALCEPTVLNMEGCPRGCIL